MEDAYSLRPAVEEDLMQVLEIEGRLQVAPWSLQHFQSELTKPYSRFWVLTDDETDEKIAGYIVAWMMGGSSQILNLGVDLPFRGLGFAQRMIRKLIQEALREKINTLTLEVRKSNQAAIQLYQKLGFSVTHVRKRFYSNGEDAYEMELRLEGERDHLL